MKLPRHVTIGPFSYDVHSDKAARQELGDLDQYGATDNLQQLILVTPDGSNGARAETLLHEILHACWDQTPLRDFDPDVEESVVAALSPLLFGVLRANPKLVKALTDA